MRLTSVYAHRFSLQERENRFRLWQIVSERVLTAYIHPADTVIDVGAGTGEFLRAVRAGRKIALDPISPRSLAREGITVFPVSLFHAPAKLRGTADVVMMSNILEHLHTAEELMGALKVSKQLMRKGGRLIIIQPTIDMVGTRYWDFVDHRLPITRAGIREALEDSGFTLLTFIPRFLPYTTKSRMPKLPVLLHAYLLLPWFLRPFAGQCLVVAKVKGRDYRGHSKAR